MRVKKKPIQGKVEKSISVRTFHTNSKKIFGDLTTDLQVRQVGLANDHVFQQLIQVQASDLGSEDSKRNPSSLIHLHSGVCCLALMS